MNLKLDEHLGASIQQIFEEQGHDARSVREQGLSGKPDETVFERCRAERRVLVTLDRGFGNPLRFNHAENAGVAVLQVPEPIGRDRLAALALTLARALGARSIEGRLWIVRPGVIRERPAWSEGDDQEDPKP